MKKNKISAESLQGLGSSNSRFTTKVLAFNPEKDASKISQNAASMGIVLNEGDQFIINELLMTEVKPSTGNTKPINTLALAISRVIDGKVSDKVELLPISRFVNTLIDVPQSSVNSALERIADADKDAYQSFVDYAASVRNEPSKVFYRGEGAVNFAKELLAKSGTDASATVFTVDKFHSHTAEFTYSPEQAKARGADKFTAVQQHYILSV